MPETSSASKNGFRRYDLQTDIVLAVMPTAVMIGVLLLLNFFGRQEVLFSSLASSAFLIYLDPQNTTNSSRTLLIAQLSAAVVGYLTYTVMGAGYASAAVSMILAILIMIVTRAMHPPAVSTALLFAFQHTKPNTLLMFCFAVLLLILLMALQRTSVWLIKRSERKRSISPPGDLTGKG